MEQINTVTVTLSKAVALIKSNLPKMVDLNEGEVNVISYYVVQSWIYEVFPWIGILRAIGPISTGKTTLCDKVLMPVAYQPFKVLGNASVADMRREMINSHRAGKRTFICDDVAFECRRSSARSDNFINRCAKDGGARFLEPNTTGLWVKNENVIFGPTILGYRNAFEDVAIESRCLDIAMGMQQRTGRDLQPEWSDKLRLIIALLECFRQEATANLKPEKPAKSDQAIEDRLWDIGWPMVFLAHLSKDQEGVNPLTEYLIDLSNDLRTEKIEEPAALVISAIVALSKQQGPTGDWFLPDPPTPLEFTEIREQIRRVNRFDLANTQIGKILRQFGFKNDVHIYTSGGYTKLRNIDWHVLKERAHKVGLKDDLLESM